MSPNMIETINVKTSHKQQMVDITGEIRSVLTKSGAIDGVCHVFIPHTTAAVTINENADPDVVRDTLLGLDDLISRDLDFRHAEGNSPAHIKSTLVGISESIFISRGDLLLGTWQGVYFCEFDGPRNRKAIIRITDDQNLA